MKLLSLTLENFKGIKRFEFTPGGKDARVYGDNGTGKTTLADAYFWLLFGKDSAGRSDSNFDVIPHDSSGLDCSVRGEFFSDAGQSFALQRVYKQVFSRKNGEAERELKSNTTEFYIDGVPKPKKDYTEYVSKICDESTLMLLTDPDRFPGKMRWDERRAVLVKLFAGEIADRKVIMAHAELEPLMELIGMKSVDDYAAIARERRKAINRDLAAIPGRIDEAEKAKPVGAVPLPTDGPRLGQLTVEKGALDDRISRLRSGESAATLRKEIADLEADISRAGTEYARRTALAYLPPDELIHAREDRAALAPQIIDLTYKIDGLAAQIANQGKKVSELRQACIENFSDEFDAGSTVCPTCGQTYPADRAVDIEKAWNEHHANRQEQLEADGRAAKAELDRLSAKSKDLQAEKADLESRLRNADSTIRALEKTLQNPPAWETSPEYRALDERLKSKREELEQVQTSVNLHVSRIRVKLDETAAEISAIQSRLLNKDLVTRQDARIRELMAEEKRLGVELAEIENGLRLSDAFVQAQATDIEESVNRAFRTVRWKLFDRQINGGIKSCCEATVNGIEYGTNLNSAARLNAGLDIISALSEKMGVSFPVWIDNAESVTDYLPVNSQVIRLFVSAADKQLRVEVEG